MVQETRSGVPPGVLSDNLQSIQQQLDDHTTVIGSMAARMERMEDLFATLQAILEERLPPRTAIQNNGVNPMADQEVQVPDIIPNQQPEVQNQPPAMQIDENRVPIGAEARNAVPGRPPLYEMFPDLNQQRHPIPVGEPIEPGFERPIGGPILHPGQRNGFPRQPPPYWAPIEQQGEVPWQGREFQRQPEPYYYPAEIPPPNGNAVQFREPMEPPWMQGGGENLWHEPRGGRRGYGRPMDQAAMHHREHYGQNQAYQPWQQDSEHVITCWDEFVRTILLRFGPASYDDPMESLTKLRHTTSVIAYKGQFESISNRIRNLSDMHKLSCFMSGLKDEIRLAVKMQGPRNLSEAYALSKNTRRVSNHLQKKPEITCRCSERRKKGLCYNCDEKWSTNHKCRTMKLYIMEEVDLDEDLEQVIEEESELTEESEESAEITLCALLGSTSPSTMRVVACINGKKAVVLIDTGSTHNFLDYELAKSLRFGIDTSSCFGVKVANGEVIRTKGECKDIQFKVQGLELKVNFNLLSLGGCGIVLGTQWLSTLGMISWDFNKLLMGFMYQGKQIWLKGTELPEGDVQEVLEEFQTVFEEPQGLPPNRGHEHQIMLKAEAKPTSQRPYRYPFYQKGEIEKIVQELLKVRMHKTKSLNKDTIKDKFPIPVVDELLDELQGSNIFSKLDLSQNLEEHKIHLKAVLQVLLDHQLFAKKSKCVFAVGEVEYLGHVISGRGVQTDPKKIAAMVNWPKPQTLKALRGFLGLTGYYRKFIRGYGQIASPLTELLRKDAFKWSEKAEMAFERLKEACSQPPCLALPDFSKTFVVECDASGYGIGAVLMQEGRPLAFYSQALKGKALFLSTYEKELMALVLSVKKWRPYLFGQNFVIKTDQQSLKHLLEQRIGTPMQQKWISKLLGYHFVVEFKRGKENLVADALSRQVDTDLMTEVEKETVQVAGTSTKSPAGPSYQEDPVTKDLMASVSTDPDPQGAVTYKNGLLLHKGRLYLGENCTLKPKVLALLHDSPLGGHSGYLKTYQRAKKDWFWKGMKQDIKSYVKECDTCQRIKSETTRPAGLLQPLPIPPRPWYSISMDFIEGLPKSNKQNVILVVVDRLTKFVHFMALAHPYTAAKVADLFMKNVFKLHGMPTSIVSDRDTAFTANFWQELFKIQEVELAMSSSYHPQTDGQTEVVNRSLEQYLRAFAGDKPSLWVHWLPMAEFWFNTNYHTSTKMTPFEALYGYEPPTVMDYIPGTTKVAAVDDYLHQQQGIIGLLKENLLSTQSRMKSQADKHRLERSFQVGEWVFLRLQPFRQKSVSRKHGKLAARFYGPFQIVEKVGAVAYRLELPEEAQIHNVFHVSCLKPKLGQSVLPIAKLPPMDSMGHLSPEPSRILDQRTIKRRRHGSATEVLVQWEGSTQEDATWELLFKLQQQYPHLVGKVIFHARRLSDKLVENLDQLVEKNLAHATWNQIPLKLIVSTSNCWARMYLDFHTLHYSDSNHVTCFSKGFAHALACHALTQHSFSTPSALCSSFSLPLSPSQLPLARSGGYENSLSSSRSLTPMVTRTPSLPLARSGGYGTPRYSGDHWKSGKEISLSSPPFNFRNFGFGFGFPKVDFLQLVGLFLRL
uniref:Integrase catalytic domain-containing protein n=1 Tax=Fagus sylvatica TaxID=28930 RepID=A0A2N9J200_FAGSY